MLADAIIIITAMVIVVVVGLLYSFYVLVIQPYLFYWRLFKTFKTIISDADLQQITFDKQGLEYLRQTYSNLPEKQRQFLTDLTLHQFTQIGTFVSSKFSK